MTSKSSPDRQTSTSKKKGGKVKEKAETMKKPKNEKKIDFFIHVFPDWCKGCAICVAFCPAGVLEMKNQKAVVAHPEKCIRCCLCARRCPDFAIGIADETGRVNDKQNNIQRLPEVTANRGEGDSR